VHGVGQPPRVAATNAREPTLNPVAVGGASRTRVNRRQETTSRTE
jgi:hypothetical protein